MAEAWRRRAAPIARLGWRSLQIIWVSLRTPGRVLLEFRGCPPSRFPAAGNRLQGS